MIGREGELLASGFQNVTTLPVAVPHFVWKVELDIELDRPMRFAELSLLRLVEAGVRDPKTAAELLGLAGEPIVPKYVADLLMKGMLTLKEEQLQITALGRRGLEGAVTRDEQTYTAELRHDPYRDEMRWDLEDEIRGHELQDQKLKELPTPQPLTHTELEIRHRELQEMITRDGLPFLDRDKTAQQRKRELLRVRPAKFYVAYRPAELEVWRRPETDELQWRLLRGGGEERAVSERLKEMEREGATIIPFEDESRGPEGTADVAIRTAVASILSPATPSTTPPPQILQVADHRPALAQAINDATRELIIVSPWLRRGAADEEMITWFRESLDRNKNLKIVIGFGIADDPKGGRGPSKRERESHDAAIRHLRKLEQRSRGRLQLVDLGNTHQKVVVVDDRYAIITSFNFLSFKPMPGKVLRQETGHLFTDRTAVATLKKDMVKLFASSMKR